MNVQLYSLPSGPSGAPLTPTDTEPVGSRVYQTAAKEEAVHAKYVASISQHAPLNTFGIGTQVSDWA